MAKVIALYKKPADVAVFDAYYYSTHIPTRRRFPV